MFRLQQNEQIQYKMGRFKIYCTSVLSFPYREKYLNWFPCLWIWHRSPSYFTSASNALPFRMTRSLEGLQVSASMGLTGEKSEISISLKRTLGSFNLAQTWPQKRSRSILNLFCSQEEMRLDSNILLTSCWWHHTDPWRQDGRCWGWHLRQYPTSDLSG